MTASVGVTPDHIEAVPGELALVAVMVTNDLPDASQFQVRLVGSDATWSGEPHLTPLLQPGSHTSLDLSVTLPLGFPAGDHLLGVEVIPILPGGTPSGDQRTRRVSDLVITVGSLSGLHAVLEPRNIRGREKARVNKSKQALRRGRVVRGARGGQAVVQLRNRSPLPIAVQLVASSPGDAVKIRFDRDQTVIEPGHVVPVRAKVKGKKPMFGRPRRTPFTISAQSTGNPIHLEGSFQQSARIRPGAIKGLGILTVFALWAGTLAVVFDQIGGSDEPERAITQPVGSGGNGPGSGGGGEPGSGGGGTTQPRVEASGKVSAREPGGVLVRLRSVSLVDEISQGAQFQSAMRSTSSAGVKLFGRRGGAIFNRIIPAERSTVTDEDGRWGFSGVEGDGFYELRFSKAGYATRAYVVEVPDDGSPISLDTDLEAGDGSISGLISDSEGPLGGVDITVTDGTVTLTTRTPTTGQIGTFSLDGLATPGSYLVTASRRGYGTAMELVRLSGGQSVQDVALPMTAGVGTITGNVRSAAGPLRNVTITATDGDLVRTTSTLTEGPVGSFSLPELATPGVYTLTIEGDGWLSQTRDVTLSGDQTNIGIDMIASTGIVYGKITDPTGAPIGGAGITAISDDLTYKNTTAPDGSYELVGLEPGSYVIEFQRFEFHPGSALVEFGAGALRAVNLTLSPRDSLEPEADNTLTVTLSSPEIPIPLTVLVTDRATGMTADANGTGTINAVFNNIPPGVRTLDITGQGFQETTVLARVALTGANNTAVTLRPLVVLDLQVLDIDGLGIDNADIELTRTIPECGPNSVATGCGTPLTAITGNDGRPVEIDGEPRSLIQLTDGTYQITASHPEFVQRSVTILVAYETNPNPTVSIALNRLGIIRFDVVEPNPTAQSFQAAPLEGYTVSLTPAFGTADDHTRVADAYPFAFNRIPAGTYTANLSLPGYLPITIGNIVVRLDEEVRIYRTMFKVPGATTGRVVWNPLDAPSPVGIANATVVIEGTAEIIRGDGVAPVLQPGTWTVTTDAQGQFLLPAGSGPVFGSARITVTHPDFRAPPISGVFENQTVGQNVGDLALDPLPGSITGSFRFDYGLGPTDEPPLANVSISVIDTPGSTVVPPGDITINTAQKTYTIANLPPGTYTIRAEYDNTAISPRGFAPDEVTVTVGPNQDVPANAVGVLTMAQRGSISGRIFETIDPAFVPAALDPNDPNLGLTAIDGLIIVLKDSNDDEVGRVTTGANQLRYQFEDLDPGTYTLTVVPLDGYRFLPRDTSGNPISGLQTDVVLSGQQLAGPATDIVMLKLATITGTLVGLSENTRTNLGGITINVTQGATLQDQVARPSVTTAGDGTFTIKNLDGGLVTVVSTAPSGYESFSITFEDTSQLPDGENTLLAYGETRTLPIEVEILKSIITGTVQSSQGANVPPPDLVVTLRRVTTNAVIAGGVYDPVTGTFTFSDLTPNVEYRLTLTAPNHLTSIQTMIPQAGATLDLGVIVMQRQLSSISGSVLLQVGTTTIAAGAARDCAAAPPADEDLSCTEVVLYGAGGVVVQTVLTDHTGAFTFTGVADGSYRLEAKRAGYTSREFPAQTLNVDVNVSSTNILTPVTLTALNRTVTVPVTSAVGNAPIGGATVRLSYLRNSAQPPGPAGTATQDYVATTTAAPGGIATFANVIPGDYTVSVDATGGHIADSLPTTWRLEISDNPTTNVPVQLREGLLTGFVELNGPANTNADGVVITIYETADYNDLTTTPVAVVPPFTISGSIARKTAFSIYAPSGAAYTVVATYPPGGADYLDATRTTAVLGLGATIEVASTLDPLFIEGTSAITVTVRQEGSTGTDGLASGARVTVTNPNQSQTIMTAAPDGTIALAGVAPGTYTFALIEENGFARVSQTPLSITVGPGQNLTGTLLVRFVGTISLTVTGISGGWNATLSPANGTGTLSHSSYPAQSTFTNVPIGTYTVNVNSTGGNTLLARQTGVVVTRGATTDVEVIDPATITLTVLETGTDRPVGGAAIERFLGLDAANNNAEIWGAAGTTNGSGVLVITGPDMQKGDYRYRVVPNPVGGLTVAANGGYTGATGATISITTASQTAAQTIAVAAFGRIRIETTGAESTWTVTLSRTGSADIVLNGTSKNQTFDDFIPTGVWTVTGTTGTGEGTKTIGPGVTVDIVRSVLTTKAVTFEAPPPPPPPPPPPEPEE